MADPIVQEVKDRINIAEVIGQYVSLRRAGASYKGLCPFHSEKTPSFIVTPERQLWRCFGCGEGGDVIAFLQQYEALSFPEALKILADRAGVVLPERQNIPPEAAKKKQDLLEKLYLINSLSAKFYHQALLRSEVGETARDYLKKRGIGEEAVKQWQLGFAPDDWHQLENFLKTKGVLNQQGLQAGVLTSNEKGNIYDRFRARLMFPLHDQHGRVVAFTGRTLKQDDSQAAKYINSPETQIFTKGKFLYGYYFAKRAISEADRAVVVEGHMDCLASHQAGVKNTVASGGTALTAEQLKLLKRLSPNLIFAFDTDSAGDRATHRGVEQALQMGFEVKVANLGDAKDPDELIKKDPKLWEKAINEAETYLDFAFKRIFGTINNADKNALRLEANQFFALLKLIPDPLTQAEGVKRVAEIMQLPVASAMDAFKKYSATQKDPATDGFKASASVKVGRTQLEEKIISIALLDETYLQILRQLLVADDFSTHKEIVAAIFNEAADQNLKNRQSWQMLEFVGQEELSVVEQISNDSEFLQKHYRSLVKELKVVSLQTQLDELTRAIKRAEKQKNTVDLAELMKKFQDLSQQKLTLIKTT